jgi:hypothetical protein
MVDVTDRPDVAVRLRARKLRFRHLSSSSPISGSDCPEADPSWSG